MNVSLNYCLVYVQLGYMLFCFVCCLSAINDLDSTLDLYQISMSRLDNWWGLHFRRVVF